MTDSLLHVSWMPAAGILYAEDFDEEPAPAAVAEPEEAAPEPLFSAVELEEARRLSAEAARNATLDSAEAVFLRAREAALAAIAAGVERLHAGVAAEISRATEELSRVVLSLLSAALPSLMENSARREVMALLGRLLPGLLTEKQVTVRVAPMLEEAVAADLLSLDEELRDRIELVGAEALAPGDLRVSWHEGRLVHDTAAIARAVQAIVAAASGPEVARV